MRIALLLLAFVAVLVAAAPDMENRFTKAAVKRPIRPTGTGIRLPAPPAVQTPAPAPVRAIGAPAAGAGAGLQLVLQQLSIKSIIRDATNVLVLTTFIN
ncbi:hypothetical protein PLEOSDRAFT_1105186 [Pleurotus ostreatus PC15]|uniref:Uncharacterized protein n=2 Tax=Pleurotus TaxID=5320 RepID=A0A067NH27_PLEO1|nr:hypothetical protein CCMSSC00406_0007836 [Pleurotus cornucopiae]KDQ26280.1 hypothetical protein PLEOSDRAFT_1105186 [Pleurotus ostreatus PC15]